MKKLWLLAFLLLSVTAVNAQPYGLTPLQAYSVFTENLKNDNYQTAAMYGRWLINNRPRTLEELPQYKGQRNFERMITLYTEWSKTFEDPTMRSAYLDSAEAVFNLAYETYQDDEIDQFDWHYKQGRFYQANADYIDDGLRKAYEQYEMLVALDPEKATTIGKGYYIQILAQNYVNRNEKEKALAMMKKTESFANEQTLEYFDKMRNELFDDPVERIAYLEGKLNENPDDEEILVELMDLYVEQEVQDKARATAEKLYELNPSFENVMRLADNALGNANYDRAITYLKEAREKTVDTDQLVETALDLADAYKNKEDLQTARKYAREAIKYDDSVGRAYILMAQVYSQAVNQCTSDRKMDRSDKVVYWLVLDYLDKAKGVDSSLSSTVSRQYQSYAPVLPTKEDKFFNNWVEGESIKVGANLHDCYRWIDETTTIR